MQVRLALLFAIGALTPCLGQQNGAEMQIRELRAASNQAIVRGDIAAFSSTLAENFVMVRGSGAFSDRAQYVAAFERDFTDPHSVRYERVIDRVDISRAAPLAAEHGHWIGHMPGGKPANAGTYLAMWRHTDAGWKIRSELYVMLSCDDAAFCTAYTATASEQAK
jgi:ketosteroid isomerase-like protein